MNKIIIILLLYSSIATADYRIIPSPPAINAKAYLLMDYQSSYIMVAHDIAKRLPPASLTKIMTIYIVADKLKNGEINYDDQVLVSEKAWRQEGSRMFIEVDTKVNVTDLLYGVIIQSGNDASVALAEYISGSEEKFALLMNEYAQRLNMQNTHYINSTGLPHPDHYTSAQDLALLSQALIKNFPEVYELHRIEQFSYNKIKQYNRNKLLWQDETVDGIKTGHTKESGYCLVSSAIRDNMRLISIVIGTESIRSRDNASRNLLNYGYRYYETHHLYQSNTVIEEVKVWQAQQELIKVGIINDIIITIPRGQYNEVKPIMKLNQSIIAPIKKGEQLGNLNIMLAGEVIKQEGLYAMEDILPASFLNRMVDKLEQMIDE